MNRRFGILAAALGLALVAGTEPAAAQSHTLRLGTVLAPGDPLVEASESMKQAIEERTNGDFAVEIYPSSQLGDTQDMIDQARAGANVAVFIEGSRIAPHVPAFNVLAAPYVFDSIEEAERFVETDTFKGWAEELREKTGLKLLSFNWYQGARSFLTNKPVSKPADLEGVRVRTIGEPLWIETIRAMGATPTPLAWAEVYPSLQMGVIDGAEAQPSAIYGAKLYEVVSDITLTEHILLMTGLVLSDEWFQSLPPEMQTILEEEATRAGKMALDTNVEKAGEIFAEIEKAGVTVSEIDKTPFKEAVQPVYGELGLEPYVEAVHQALGK